MFLTNRGRFAVMAIVDMAKQKIDMPVKLNDIAQRQNISIRFLEQIFMTLRQANIVKSIKGPGGGYIFARELNELSVSTIIDVMEENIKITRCDNALNKGCMPREVVCLTHHLWAGLDKQIRDYLDNISIKDIIAKEYDISRP